MVDVGRFGPVTPGQVAASSLANAISPFLSTTMRADEQISGTPAKNRDWWNDPLGVFRPDANHTALKIHGFIVGMFFGIIGVAAVALLSSVEKRGHRLIGAIPGLALSLPLWILISAG